MTDSRAWALNDLLYLGYVEKPHGLKGGFSARIYSGTGIPEIPPGTEILLDGTRFLTVTRCTPKGVEGIRLTSSEIRSREEADECRGCSIHIRRDEAEKKLEFLPLFGFVGMEIISKGKHLAIVDIDPSGSNSLLLVENGNGRFFVPLSLVLSEGDIDWKARSIVLDLPEGLEDLQV